MKCVFCLLYPECKQVYRCQYDHVSCLPCAQRNSLICCKCHQMFIGKTQNVALPKALTKTEVEVCRYAKMGCTWKFPMGSQLEMHMSECKYRPFPCIGQTLGVWKCRWVGHQDDLMSHFRLDHSRLKKPLSYFTTDSILFEPNATHAAVSLVDAFSKKREEAAQYVYEFEIKSPVEKFRKIKFIEECVSDSVPVEDILKHQQCVAVTHAAVRNHLHDQKIFFRFIVKKKEQIAHGPVAVETSSGKQTERTSKQKRDKSSSRRAAVSNETKSSIVINKIT